jgi:AraC-like DNA-binding protein
VNLTNEIEFACIEKVALERATVTGPWAWDVRVNQLSSGSFRGKLQIIRSAELMVYEQQWQRSVEVIGTTSKFCIMIGTNLAWKKTNVEWCGANLDNEQFACAAPGSEVDFKSPGGSHHVVMQVKPDVLVSALGVEAVELLLADRHVKFKAADGQRLINAMTGVVGMYAKNTELVNNPFVFRTQKSRLLKILGDCIARSKQGKRHVQSSASKTSVRDVIAYIDGSSRPLTALELARVAGVSQRSLEYAFRQQLDLTPAAYLRIHRLNAAHRELLSADPAMSTVTGIALRWGFSHPGRFSQMHRRLFDEKPSSTLKKTGV